MYTDAMKYIARTSLFWLGVFLIVAAIPFFASAEEIVAVQEVSQGHTVIDAVITFFKTFGIGFGGTVGILWIIIRLVKGNLKDRMGTMEADLRDRMGTMEVDLKDRMATMETNLKDRMEKMEHALRESINGLVKRFERMEDHPIKKSDSPVRLTEGGQRVLRGSGGIEYLGANKDALLREFSDTDDQFIIQERATKIIREKNRK